MNLNFQLIKRKPVSFLFSALKRSARSSKTNQAHKTSLDFSDKELKVRIEDNLFRSFWFLKEMSLISQFLIKSAFGKINFKSQNYELFQQKWVLWSHSSFFFWFVSFPFHPWNSFDEES